MSSLPKSVFFTEKPKICPGAGGFASRLLLALSVFHKIVIHTKIYQKFRKPWIPLPLIYRSCVRHFTHHLSISINYAAHFLSRLILHHTENLRLISGLFADEWRMVTFIFKRWNKGGVCVFSFSVLFCFCFWNHFFIPILCGYFSVTDYSLRDEHVKANTEFGW